MSHGNAVRLDVKNVDHEAFYAALDGDGDAVRGAPSRKGQVRAGHGNRTTAIRDSERALALQAESVYRRTIADWKATRPPATTKTGASVTPGRAPKEVVP